MDQQHVVPPTPDRAGWYDDPWGDGRRWFDGSVWTRALGPAGSEPLSPPGPRQAPGGSDAAARRPVDGRNWELAAQDDDERPFRPGWVSAMIWVTALIGIVLLVSTAVSALAWL